MSAAILKALAVEAGHAHWQIDSGGLSAWPGAPASSGSVVAAGERGLDIRDHRASAFDVARAAGCDLILVHSGEHYHTILTWDERFEENTFLISRFPEPGDPGPEAWIADPIGMDQDAYRKTFEELERYLRRIVPRIEAWAGERQ